MSEIKQELRWNTRAGQAAQERGVKIIGRKKENGARYCSAAQNEALCRCANPASRPPSLANYPSISPRRRHRKKMYSRDGAAVVSGNVQIYINIYIHNTLFTSSAPPPAVPVEPLQQSHVRLRSPGELSGTPPQNGERLGTLMLMSPMLMLRGISGRFMFLTAETARAGAAERPPCRNTAVGLD